MESHRIICVPLSLPPLFLPGRVGRSLLLREGEQPYLLNRKQQSTSILWWLLVPSRALQVVPEIREFLFDLEFRDDNELHRISLEVEPREPKKSA